MTDTLSPVPLTKDKLLDIKRTLMLLHAEMHNPGAARYIAQDVDLDALTDDAIYRIEHVLESMRPRL